MEKKSRQAQYSAKFSQGWGWERVMKELDKCDVLCSNCHRKHHAREALEAKRVPCNDENSVQI